MNPQDPRTEAGSRTPRPPAASPTHWAQQHSWSPSSALPPPTGWPTPTPQPGDSRRLRVAVGSTAAIALVIGGVAGAVIVAKVNGSNNSSAPATAVTAPPSPAEVKPTIPATPDPVCAEWAPIADAYAAKLKDWGSRSGDPTLPATTWTPEQRALNMASIPIMRDQVDDLNRLAAKAKDPFLASLLRAQAMYEEAFIPRLPNYEPSDRPLWQAVYDFSGAVRAACRTVQPR